MKSSIRTIIVIVVFGLATGCLAMVKGRPELESHQVDRESEEYNRQVEKLNRARQKELEASLPKGYGGRAVALTSVEPVVPGTGTPYSGGGRVLVIPAAQSTAEELLTITEDMSVMSYIFDEKLGHAHLLSPRGYGGYGDLKLFGGYGGGGYFGLESSATQSIYLDGYGALFLMKVDFPLSPPAKTPEEEKPEEGVDPVWQEAKQKISEPEDGRLYWRRRKITTTRPEKKYDAEKVEGLKRKLTKALKHAANIRHLKPDDQVILSVTGRGEFGRVTTKVEVLPSGGRQVLTVVKKSGDIEETKIARIYNDPAEAEAAVLASKMGPSSPTVMTIRVKKADVDAFAEGDLDFDKFRRKVQIFTH